jgi:hypothetical protein
VLHAARVYFRNIVRSCIIENSNYPNKKLVLSEKILQTGHKKICYRKLFSRLTRDPVCDSKLVAFVITAT